jgi:hemerythrin-like domain-containing protein
MNFQRQVSRMLDAEHHASLDLLGQVEQAFVRASRAGSTHDAELAALAARLGRNLEHDVGRHFDFEEQQLFPRMVDSGDGGMAALLGEEHAVIREVALELLPLTRAAAAGELDAEGWRSLARGALEMVERQVSHIQKETMALLPLLDDLLDDDTDRELALAYASE